jgi:hypothetical protein
MEATCVARRLLLDVEYSMMFKLLAFNLSFGCPPSTLTMYVSKALKRNIHMLIENYRAMRKLLETKVKKKLTR